MTQDDAGKALTHLLRETIARLVRGDDFDLTARQLSVFLTCYLRPPPHTVRGMAADFQIAKPAITRAIDRLEQFGLVRRQIDSKDRRSVLVTRTVAGSKWLTDLRQSMSAAAEAQVSAPVEQG